MLHLLEFSYLFSLLSPRQSAPFEYSFVSENSSNYWLKQTFCGFFVRQSLSTYPKIEETIQILFLLGWYMADIVCISLSYLLLFHYYYCLAGTKNDKTILAGKSIHLSFCGLLYSQDIPNFRPCLHSCLKADDYDESF